jgi:hypothetical protein
MPLHKHSIGQRTNKVPAPVPRPPRPPRRPRPFWVFLFVPPAGVPRQAMLQAAARTPAPYLLHGLEEARNHYVTPLLPPKQKGGPEKPARPGAAAAGASFSFSISPPESATPRGARRGRPRIPYTAHLSKEL